MKVSILTPTRNRPQYITKLANDVLSQTYQHFEWVIVCDGPNIEHLLPKDDRIKYHQLDEQVNIGTARNLTCEYATGELMIGCDDDDRYSPEYINLRLAFHLKSGKQTTGVGALVLYDESTNVFTRYQMTAPYFSGCSLTFYRDWWTKHPFSNVHEWEDTLFIQNSMKYNEAEQDNTLDPVSVVAITHPNNTCPRDPLYRTNQWCYTVAPVWFYGTQTI